MLFTVILALAFSLLRPYNSLVYAPKLKVADDEHAPPPMGKGIFAWVKPLLFTKEQDLIVQIGLDATIFLRVLRMCRNMFLVMAVVGCAVLMPLYMKKGKSTESQEFIFKITPANTWGSDTWGITVCAWIFNLTVCFFLWWNYRVVLRLRRQYYDSPQYQNSMHSRTLMVGVVKYFSSQPY